MGELVLGGLDVVGDDMSGDDMSGELEGSMVLGRGPRHRAQRVPTPRWMNATTSQGVSRPQEELDYLPFDPFVTTAALTGFLIARPQRPFRSERLIMTAIASSGDDVANGIVIDPAIYVGAVQVGASQGAAPISTFSANAFGVRLSMPAAGQGTDIKIFVRLLAAGLIPGGGSVTVTATLIGRAMR